jgi:hypothetical protein
MSDFDDYDDLDAVRDVRGLTDPFPVAVDAGVRRRIFELAAERGYEPAAARDSPRGGPPTGGRARGPAEPPGAGGSAPPVVVLERTGQRSNRHTARVAAAAAITVVLIVAAALLARRAGPPSQVDTGGQGPEQSVPEAATTSVAGLLRVVADKADSPLPAGSVQHIHVERLTTSVYDDPKIPSQQSVEVADWRAGADGPGQFELDVYDTPDKTGEPGHRSQQQSAAMAFDGVSYQWLRTLPTEPVALRARIEQEIAESGTSLRGPAVVLGRVLDRLIQPVLPPAVRAASIRLLVTDFALAPLGPRVDRRGNPSFGFTADDGAGVWTVLVDVRGKILEWERRDRALGMVDSYAVILEAEVLGS